MSLISNINTELFTGLKFKNQEFFDLIHSLNKKSQTLKMVYESEENEDSLEANIAQLNYLRMEKMIWCEVAEEAIRLIALSVLDERRGTKECRSATKKAEKFDTEIGFLLQIIKIKQRRAN